MKYKRITRPYLNKPIPKHSSDKEQIKKEMLAEIGNAIDQNLRKLKEGQAISIYYIFQVYNETSEESRLIRNSEDYKKWRDDVYKRDHYTCQNCEVTGKRLNAHHILKFSKDKKKILDIKNGITF